MAKITIEISDDPITGKVKLVSTPSFNDMMKMSDSGYALTPAHTCALFVLMEVWKEHRANVRRKLTDIAPRIGRA